MKRVANILAAALAALSVRAGGGHREALRLAVGTNGVAAARAAVARVDWRDVRDPAAEIRVMRKLVEGRAGFEGVERELKTQLRLLTPGAKMDGSDGTLPVPVAEAAVVPVAAVPLPHLRAVRVPFDETGVSGIPLAGTLAPRLPAAGGAGLCMPVALSGGVEVLVSVPEGLVMPVSLSRSAISGGLEETCGAFVVERDLWAARYGKLRRFARENGKGFAPDRGTSLDCLRREIESGAERYDALIDSYNERAERVLWRARALKGQGGSR